MKRHLLGIIGLVFVVTFLVTLLTGGTANDRGAFFASIMLRVGSILCLTWLAFPQLVGLASRLPKWAWGAIAVVLGVAVAVPKAFPVVFALIGLLAIIQFFGWMMKPPAKRQAQRNKATSQASATNKEASASSTPDSDSSPTTRQS